MKASHPLSHLGVAAKTTSTSLLSPRSLRRISLKSGQVQGCLLAGQCSDNSPQVTNPDACKSTRSRLT